MPTGKSALWLVWLCMLAAIAASAAFPFLAGPERPIWPDARASVLTFCLTLIAMVAGIGSLAVRETLVRGIASGTLDPQSVDGASSVRSGLLRAWVLCVVVALLGFSVAWVAAEPARVWPYDVGAAALLLFHAPRRSVLERP